MELTCKDCRYFSNEAEWLEANLKGMTSFSSGYAAVKAEDGLCAKKDILLTPIRARNCQEFQLTTKEQALKD
ncbi:MAG TPA: hypothetical protein VH186_20825 [Chloroflexia bacterium]|nr:hypothetical protein [Chloroflexia bacterium]